MDTENKQQQSQDKIKEIKQETKSKTKPNLLISSLTGLVSIAIGLGIGYLTFNKPAEIKTINKESDKKVKTEKTLENNNINNYKSFKFIKKAYKNMKSERQMALNLRSAAVKMENGTYLETEGFGLSNASNYPSGQEAKKDEVKIKEYLADKGLKLVEEQGSKGERKYSLYQNKDIYCSLQSDFMENDNYKDNSKTIHLGCIDKDYFKETSKLVDKIMGNDKDSSKAPKDALIVTHFNPDSLKEGKTKGYKTAMLSGSSLIGPGGWFMKFYQTPDGQWHSSVAGNGTPECKEYTEEAKKAFKDVICVNGNNKIEKNGIEQSY